jgi:hypothetical protein
LATAALLGVGAALWAYGTHRLTPPEGLRFKPNPLALKMSAYGQVIGMAMQGPVDSFWHEGSGHDHDHDHDHHGDDPHCDHDHDHDHGTLAGSAGSAACSDCAGHDDQHAAGCPQAAQAAATAPTSLREQAKQYLRDLGAGVNERTNPHANSTAHRFYLRRQIENRLRLAYEFDPSNYGTYNSYHLFLTESSLATRTHAEQQVLHLANWTIHYCLRENHDPRPALTAAAAAHDIITAMLGSQTAHPRASYDASLATLDTALARHLRLLRERQSDGSLTLISATRRTEMNERLRMLVRLRDADETAIRRRFGQLDTQQAGANHHHPES